MSRYAEISTFSKTCIFFLLCFLTTHLCLAHHSSLLYAFTPGQHRLVVFWSSYIFLHYFLKRNPCLAAQGSSLGTTLLMSIRLSKMQKYPMICVTGCFCLWAACHFLKTKTLNFGICSILFGPAGRFPPPAVQRSETVAALQYEGWLVRQRVERIAAQKCHRNGRMVFWNVTNHHDGFLTTWRAQGFRNHLE